VRVRVVLALLASLSFALRQRDAGAADVRAQEGQQRVLLIIAAERDEAEQLAQVAGELLGRLSVTVQVSRAASVDVTDIARLSPSDRDYLARIYVDLRAPDQAILWFVDSRRDRVLLRKLARAPDTEELTREELGHIIETSTEGVLSGAEIGRPRAEVIPMPQTKRRGAVPSRASTSEPASWQIALLYEVQGFATAAHIVHGPEASFFLPLPTHTPALGMWVTGQYRLPVTVEQTSVGADLEGGAFRALLTLDAPLHSRVKLRGAAGAGADIVHVAPHSAQAAGVSLAEDSTLSFFVIRAAFGIELRLSAWICLWSRFAADVDFTGTRYVFERNSGDVVVLEPWPIRPAIAVGIGFP
jgi:hypothetical protein